MLRSVRIDMDRKARSRRLVGALALAMAASFGAAACGGGGSSGSSGGASGSTSGAGVQVPPGSQHGSASNAPQWQTALTALAQAQANAGDPLRLETPALASLNELLRRAWPGVLPLVTDAVHGGLAGQAGQRVAGVTVHQIHSVRLDFQAAPALRASQPAPQQTVELELPRVPARWSLGFTAEVGGTVSFLGMSIPIHIDVDVQVVDISILQGLDLDLTQLHDVRIVGPTAPRISFGLVLDSSLLSAITGPLTQILDPAIRLALTFGAGVIQREVAGFLQLLPQGPAWGLGGPGAQPVPNAAPLEPVAIDVADTIQLDHMPFDHVFPANYDAPHQGGQVTTWEDHGDSAIWTGHYLASEVYRYDLTQSPQALQYAARTVRGLELLLDVAQPGGGLLSRAAIPTHSPHAAPFYHSNTHFVGTVNGVQYVFLEHISRDQYTGFMMGMGQAWYRVPALRADAARLIERVVSYLESTGWIAHRADLVTMSTQFVQSPATLLAFSRLGSLVAPARLDAAYQANKPIAGMMWFADWFSGREVHESYYKFNLGHANLLTLVELETEPEQYRKHLLKLRMLRQTIGHHDNAWFDAIYATAVPTEAPVWGPKIKNALDRWVLRPSRGFSAQNSLDPTIAQATYTITSPNATGGTANTQVHTGPRQIQVAVHPIPIEKRTPTDFLWQRNPFQLDGGRSPHHQAPGIDLVAPYWLARNHGILP